MSNKIKVTLDNCLRRIFDVWEICSITQEFVKRRLTTFGAMRRIALHSLLKRIVNSDNCIISCIYFSASFKKSVFMTEYNNCMYDTSN